MRTDVATLGHSAVDKPKVSKNLKFWTFGDEENSVTSDGY